MCMTVDLKQEVLQHRRQQTTVAQHHASVYAWWLIDCLVQDPENGVYYYNTLTGWSDPKSENVLPAIDCQ